MESSSVIVYGLKATENDDDPDDAILISENLY